MVDEKENTWFRRNLVGVLIATLIVLLGYVMTDAKASILERIDIVNRAYADHEARIRVLEHKP